MSAASLRPQLEVADILRAHGAVYRIRHPVSREQSAVVTHVGECLTAALGGAGGGRAVDVGAASLEIRRFERSGTLAVVRPIMTCAVCGWFPSPSNLSGVRPKSRRA